MAYQVLARKYRPQRFADVAGQDHVTVTLMNALTQGRIAHGYIFSGHRGIGKTTIARILAMALNCQLTVGTSERPTPEPCGKCINCREISSASRNDVSAFEESHSFDVEEIDAATRRGIDDAKLLTSKIDARPTNRSKYKILILDEAHQLTDAAWNALLKTLEEPPPWAIFMFATTQPEDIPQTVRSRCQHFSFHAVKLVDILSELRGIADREGVDADEGALALLAEAGDGSMRDALSIMDQAIASAPVQDGKPVLDASQIRELMGTVPNAVFEKILEAVDGNRSAEVITVANQLLDAGNSPAQLARQFVRYLRNCVIAKIAGIGADGADANGVSGELLQISADEQRRAGRSAALFGEEELTRFLQVMLRTFDELGYRQEQRFHFELGLLKLVHLRRLLPVEEVLSQFPVAGNAGQPRTQPAAPQARISAPTPVANRVIAAPAAVSTKPAFSPFEADKSRKRFEGGEAGKTPAAPAPVAGPIKAAEPVPAAAPLAETISTPVSDISVTEVAAEILGVGSMPIEAIDPEIAVAAVKPESLKTSSSATELQRISTEALMNAKSQGSAADALADAEWTVDGSELRVQTELSKTMLPMVVNVEAEKIVRAALRDAGAGALKLVLLPGVATAAVAKKPRAAKSGSAQAKAMEHPVVQQAQRLFDAEIRNVIDLSEGE